jgi:hypothetical protein
MRSAFFLILAATSAVGSPSRATDTDSKAFQQWVSKWAGEQDAWIADWWSANLEEDDKASDYVAKVCRLSKPSIGVFLVQSSTGKRFIVRFEDDTYGNPVCDMRTQGQRPLLRSTDDRFIHHAQPIKRAGDDEVWLAVRDSALLIVAEQGDASYGGKSLRGDHTGRRARELRGQVDSTYVNLHPWSGSWDSRKQ